MISAPATLVDRELGTYPLSSMTRLNSSLFPILSTPYPKEKDGISLIIHCMALAALRVEGITLRMKKTNGTIPP
jgi:hypothetical protein